jgi:MFS family permease
MQMAMLGARIVGPAAAGALVAAFGPRVCYAVDFASFVISALLISSVTIVRPSITAAPQTPAPERGRVGAILHEMGEGMRFIANHAAISFVVMAMAAGMFVMGCFGPLIAIYVREWLHAQAGVFGLVLSGLAGIGLGALLLGALPWVAMSMLACFTLGFAFAGVIVPAQTLMQQETPPKLMGRISSTVMSVVFFAQLIGLALSGVLAQSVGVRAVFFLCAGLAWALTGAGKLLLSSDRHAAATA